MIPRLAFALFLFLVAGASPLAAATNGRVTGLRLEPNGTHTQLIVHLEGGNVLWDDFLLADPTRIVIDLVGVRSEIGGRFERIDRGGVAGVRVSQHAADVVRVVVDVQRHSRYSVDRTAEGIRITLAGTGANGFEPWSTGAPASVRPAPPLPPRQGVQRQERRITVAFFEADIQDVLASFAEFAGRSIVPGAGVTGKVTAEIRNQPWDVALETILTAHGLAVRELPSGIIRVDAAEKLREREDAMPLLTESYRVNYVPVAELAMSLQSLKTERGSIVPNPSTNMLIVTDVAPAIATIRSMVRQLDIQTPQVAIQTKIMFINRSNIEELGIVYDLRDRRLGPTDIGAPGTISDGSAVLLNGGLIGALGNAADRITSTSLEAIISVVIRRHTLVAFLDALQQSSLSEVQAAPMITTLDNQEAEIWVGQRTPIRVIDTGTAGPGGVAGAPRATAQLVETGIRLRVTPTITGDRRILMQLHAERSSATPAPGEIGVSFQTQQGNTRLMVNDGETAVIGGLTVTERFTRRSGIPLLMDIPGIGALFRTTKTEEQKRDLLIMVTPHIVEDRM